MQSLDGFVQGNQVLPAQIAWSEYVPSDACVSTQGVTGCVDYAVSERSTPMLDRRVKLSQDALFQDIGGEGVILDLASASYFGLDEVGVSFWKQLQSDSSFQRACAELLLHFDVEPSQLANDLDALVRQLVDAGLVTVEQGIA